jgi:hypothetical protein
VTDRDKVVFDTAFAAAHVAALQTAKGPHKYRKAMDEAFYRARVALRAYQSLSEEECSPPAAPGLF